MFVSSLSNLCKADVFDTRHRNYHKSLIIIYGRVTEPFDLCLSPNASRQQISIIISNRPDDFNTILEA